MLLDWFAVNQVIAFNPAAYVLGPTYVMKKGNWPDLSPEDMRQLFVVINTETLVGIRDRALFGVMLYSFASVGAVVDVGMKLRANATSGGVSPHSFRATGITV